MPSLFPHRVQRRRNGDPVRSYASFCRYLLDMAPPSSSSGDGDGGKKFEEERLPFVGRNRVIYSRGSPGPPPTAP